MLKIKDNVDLKELEKLGFRKHKQDEENILVSKWIREWVEADSIDGYKCGSDGWNFYPLLKITNNLEIKFCSYWPWDLDEANKILQDLISKGLVEVEE
jgi:hypothetical protein